MQHQHRKGRRIAQWLVTGACVLALAACGGGDSDGGTGGGGGGGAGQTPPGGGTGGGASQGGTPAALSGLNMPAPVTVPGVTGGLLSLDPSRLNVRRAVDLVFSTGHNPGSYDPFLRDVVNERRDDIFALDWATGRTRQLVTRRPSGSVIFPLPLFTQGPRLYYAYPEFDGGFSVFLEEIDPQTGGLVSQTQISAALERCFVVVGDDFFFGQGDEFVVVRDFASRGFAEPEALAEVSVCGDAMASLDGALVALEYPADETSTKDLTAWEVDPQTGERLAPPLAAVPSDVLRDQNGFQVPRVVVANDGIYALAFDAVTLELWFIGYARRPGEPDDGAASPPPELLGRIEMPFFAEVIPGAAILSVEEVFSFAAEDGVVSLNLRLREEAADGTFFWSELVVADVYADAVDLIDLGGRVRESAVRTGN